MRFTLIIFLALCLLFISCTDKNEKKTSAITFDLYNDLYNFSEKMRNGDTILINAMIGVCTSNCKEFNTVFKLNDSVFIQSTVVDIFPNGESKSLIKTYYSVEKNDTLNFENFFSYVKTTSIEPDPASSCTLQAIYKKDTIEFFANNLVKFLKQIDYYNRIKARIYPDEEVFKPEIVTEE